MISYTGGGVGGSRPNIPARNLSKSEIKNLAKKLSITQREFVRQLLESGLYKKLEEETTND
jgi:hypothetical protein